MSTEVYFIRPSDELLKRHVVAPRTLETIRRSLDGELCIVSYDEDQVPTGWLDGMTAEQCMELINAPEAMGTWWAPE